MTVSDDWIPASRSVFPTAGFESLQTAPEILMSGGAWEFMARPTFPVAPTTLTLIVVVEPSLPVPVIRQPLGDIDIEETRYGFENFRGLRVSFPRFIQNYVEPLFGQFAKRWPWGP